MVNMQIVITEETYSLNIFKSYIELKQRSLCYEVCNTVVISHMIKESKRNGYGCKVLIFDVKGQICLIS